MRDGCKCSGKWIVVHSEMKGHCLVLGYQCNKCGTSELWNGSNQFPDQSFAVNRDMVRSWLTIGGERGKYFQFCEAMKIGTYNRASFDRTITLLTPIILELEDKNYKLNIDSVNGSDGECILGFDGQYSRSQKKGKTAPFMTCTFMCQTQGVNYGKILFQSHLSTHQMKEMGMNGTESKDKHATIPGLKKMASLLNHIDKGVCDGSSSGNKQWRDIVAVKGSKHQNALLANCTWHKLKGLESDFNNQMRDKKVKLAVKEGRKQYKDVYPEIKELEIDGKTMKNHWIYCQKLAEGNAERIESIFREYPDSMQEIAEGKISNGTMTAWHEWMKKVSNNMEKYSDGLLTDLEESFHRVALKYWKKGSSLCFEEYIVRRALAFLDWNENFGKPKLKRTTDFRKEIARTFTQFLSTKINNRNSEHQVYKPKRYGITDYVFS